MLSINIFLIYIVSISLSLYVKVQELTIKWESVFALVYDLLEENNPLS
jgi:hypothetical protein